LIAGGFQLLQREPGDRLALEHVLNHAWLQTHVRKAAAS
jgi:hypothetical protein